MNKTRLLWLVGLVALFAAAAYFLPIAAWTTWVAEGARQTGSVGIALFIVAYIVATVAFLPGSILTLAAGFAYGPLWGVLIVSPASVAGATAAFLLGRTLLRGWAVRKTRGSPQLRAIEHAVEREGFKLVLLLRLSPVIPFNVLNYALSLSNVRLGTYIVASAVGMFPATVLYVYLGSLAPTAAQLSTAAETADSSRALLYAAGLAATAAAVFIVTRAARRALHTELQR